MSTTSTPKRPPATGNTATKKPLSSNGTSSSTAPLNRSPSRATTDTNAVTTRGASSTATVNRVRSVRNAAGAPVYARAAARKPAQLDAAETNEEEEDTKAALQAKVEELQTCLREAESAIEDSKKSASVLQVRLDESLREQGVLEEREHEHVERIEELESERREGVRARRELELIYEAERAQMIQEKEAALAKEEEMQTTMQRLREKSNGLHQLADEDSRPSSISRNGSFRRGSPGPDGAHFAPTSSVQRSDSRSSSRLLMQKDKVIEGLRLDLAEAQIKLVELENQGGGRVHELQKEMYEVKMQNARLMEENESFQLLLSEKTLNGDFAQSELLRAPSTSGSQARSRSPLAGASLADELEGRQDEVEANESITEDPIRQLQIEINSLKDQNKALTLYINNIISRLLQHDQFEAILDKTPDLIAGPAALSRKFAATEDSTEKDLPPPPPPPKNDAAVETPVGSLLQRARSVMGAAARPKPRPTSVYQTAPIPDYGESRANENPDTAPRIPLARSGSSAARGHRRANSDWPTGSVTSMMYRGPAPGIQGTISPGLTSPTLTNRPAFFASSSAARAPSSGSSPAPVQAIQEHNDKENSRPTSSSQQTSQRDSSISNFGSGTDADHNETDSATTPASPPRSINSGSGDRDRGDIRAGPAIMMGSKPRPLRLVQEAQDDEKARKAANRGSWFGWMNKGGIGLPNPGQPGSGAQ